MGYYEGKSLKQDGEEISWKGKYLIVWKKEANDWKMYMDIWNRI
jgi:ketosteroid isomerase-like protein